MSKKQTEIAFEHMSTNIHINTSDVCSKCPFKLYTKPNETVTLGAGNMFSNLIFILPTYNTKDKVGYSNLLEVLAKTYKELKGKSIFEDVYITRLVKCSKRTDHVVYDAAIKSCSKFLIYELNKLEARHIVFFGSAYDDYISNSDTVGYNLPKKYIYKIYSPAVLFYDNSKIKEKFINDLNYVLSYI